MVRIVGYVVIVLALAWGAAAAAQETWVQIEARPTEALAEERAAEWQGRFADVQGYRLRSGWHAIALGPYDRLRAESELIRLRAAGLIPRDSFIADGSQFVSQFWPGAGAIAAAPIAAAPQTPASTPAADPVAPEETVAQSTAAERLLTRTEREEVQRALAWQGVYSAAIDGDFGPGTRRAMGAWQDAKGYVANGILSTAQRRELVDGFRTALQSLDLRRVNDGLAGIGVDLPAGIVRFAGHASPFARYEATDGGDEMILLISQAGDRDRLAGLYEVMQTLAIVPTEGPRSLARDSFTLTGIGTKTVSHSYAEHRNGEIKGYTIVWPADDLDRFRLVEQAVAASFAPVDGIVLPEETGVEQRPDLVAGLAIRRPERTMSGFFVSQDGAVLTAAAAVEGCGRVEIGDDVTGTVAARDDALGVALLRPATPLRPIGYARFAPAAPALRSELAVAGFSYGGLLGAPSLTFGSLEDVRGLDGNPDLRRLAVAALPGDTGGPVLDMSGSVAGLLLPVPEGDRVLPEGVAFAGGSDALAAFLATQGIRAVAAQPGAAMPPEDLATAAADMTVLVSCWAD